MFRPQCVKTLLWYIIVDMADANVGIILGMGSTNESRSLISWAHIQNDPCNSIDVNIAVVLLIVMVLSNRWYFSFHIAHRSLLRLPVAPFTNMV